MASSTTRPIASTIASKVRVLIENPKKYMIPKAPISDTGMVTMGIRLARRLRRKKKITSTTRMMASATVWYTRSEEHTSELQSLMRISYAVFCLKKKKTTKNDKQFENAQTQNKTIIHHAHKQ